MPPSAVLARWDVVAVESGPALPVGQAPDNSGNAGDQGRTTGTDLGQAGQPHVTGKAPTNNNATTPTMTTLKEGEAGTGVTGANRRGTRRDREGPMVVTHPAFLDALSSHPSHSHQHSQFHHGQKTPGLAPLSGRDHSTAGPAAPPGTNPRTGEALVQSTLTTAPPIIAQLDSLLALLASSAAARDRTDTVSTSGTISGDEDAHTEIPALEHKDQGNEDQNHPVPPQRSPVRRSPRTRSRQRSTSPAATKTPRPKSVVLLDYVGPVPGESSPTHYDNPGLSMGESFTTTSSPIRTTMMDRRTSDLLDIPEPSSPAGSLRVLHSPKLAESSDVEEEGDNNSVVVATVASAGEEPSLSESASEGMSSRPASPSAPYTPRNLTNTEMDLAHDVDEDAFEQGDEFEDEQPYSPAIRTITLRRRRSGNASARRLRGVTPRKSREKRTSSPDPSSAAAFEPPTADPTNGVSGVAEPGGPAVIVGTPDRPGISRWTSAAAQNTSTASLLRKATIKVVLDGPLSPVRPGMQEEEAVSPYHVVVDLDADADDDTESLSSVSVVSEVTMNPMQVSRLAGETPPSETSSSPDTSSHGTAVDSTLNQGAIFPAVGLAESLEQSDGSDDSIADASILSTTGDGANGAATEMPEVNEAGEEFDMEDDFAYLDEIENQLGQLSLSRGSAEGTPRSAPATPNPAAVLEGKPLRVAGEIKIQRIPTERHTDEELAAIPHQKMLLEDLETNDFKRELLASIRRKHKEMGEK